MLTETGQDSLNLLDDRLELILLVDSISELGDSIVGLVLDERSNQADSILAMNAAIVDAEKYEFNEKSVNCIYLNTLAKGISTLDSFQMDSLIYVADQCPLEGGTAVYRARALLYAFSDLSFDDSISCSPAQPFISPPGKLLETVKIFPNPATHEVTVKFSNMIGTGEELWLINVYGQQTTVFQLPEGDKNYSFSVAKFSSGVYFVKIIKDGKEKSTQCLVIMK